MRKRKMENKLKNYIEYDEIIESTFNDVIQILDLESIKNIT